MTLTDALSRGRRRKVTRESTLSGGQTDSKGTALYHCNYCERDISRTVRIKCAVCQDFDLCLDCFSVGVEVTPHKSDHAYRVVDNLSFPLFHPDWGADEELLLLEAIEMFGLGNWTAVAEHMGPSKTPLMCKTHWYQIYVDSPAFPLPTAAPEMNGLDPAKMAQEAKTQVKTTKAPAEVPRRKRGRPPSNPAAHQAVDREQTKPTEPVAGPDPSTPGHGKKGAKEPAKQADPAGSAEGAEGLESAGRGPKRPRHAHESTGEDEAAAPTRMQISGRTMHHAAQPAAGTTQTPTEGEGAGGPQHVPGQAGPAQDVKVAGEAYQLTGYNQKRNEFDPEFDNDAELLLADMEFHEDDTEEERADKLRIIEIYNHRLDERERRRDFILQHQLLNIRRTQAQEKRRSGLEKEIHASLRVLARYQGPEEQEALAESMMVERRLRQRIHELKECRRLGSRTLSEAESHLEEQRKKMAADHAALGVAAAAQLLRIPAAPVVRGANMQMFTPQYGLPTALTPMLTGRSGATALDTWRCRRGYTLDLRCLPGTNILSQKERELCARLRILPPHYLLVKDSLMRDYKEHGELSRSEVRDFFRLDPTKAGRIYDMLVTCGWINGGIVSGEKHLGPTPSTSMAQDLTNKHVWGDEACHRRIKLEDDAS